MLRTLIYNTLPGTWIGAPVDCDSISTDTRTMSPGALYIAVPGKQADGHQYIPEAIRLGARAVMVTRVQPNCPVPQWVVKDVYEAVCFIVSQLRNAFTGPVVAITGSVGKTSTKRFITQILSRSYSVLSTDRNWNTEYGLAQLLWSLNAGHECIVVEMGAKHPGDIATLCQLLRPTMGVVTNIQEVHIGFYPSFAALIETKTALLASLCEAGKAAIALDDPLLCPWLERFPPERRASYSRSAGTVHVRDFRLEEGHACFQLIHQQASHESEALVRLQVLGAHQVENALAAAAVATFFKMPIADIALGLSTTTGTQQRLMRYMLPTGAVLYDDSYNGYGALAAIAHLALDVPTRTTLFVMTDMVDLPAESVARRHEELCRAAREAGIHHLWCLGPAMKAAALAFGPNARHFEQQSDLINALISFAHGNMSVLIKGARGQKMERVVEALCPMKQEKAVC